MGELTNLLTNLPPTQSTAFSVAATATDGNRRSDLGLRPLWTQGVPCDPRKFPCCNSAYACRNSSWVFITIGPYQASGSSGGLPKTRKKSMVLAGLDVHFVATVEEHERGLSAFCPPRLRGNPSSRQSIGSASLHCLSAFCRPG
jgi:hypothetical protein